MANFSSGASLYLAAIIAAYAVLGLIVYVPGLIAGASTLMLIGIVIIVIAVLLFAAAIILKALSQLLASFRA